MTQSLLPLLEKHSIAFADAINCHVHLPKITEELTGSYSSQDHSLLPPHLLQEILPTLDPDHFFAHNPGMHCLLAVEEHNFLGKACPIYSPNDYILELARTYPERVIPFGSIPLNEHRSRSVDSSPSPRSLMQVSPCC